MLFLNRTACLGGWVQGLKFGDGHAVYNQQKVRADMFMNIINKKSQIPDMKPILPLLSAINDMSYMYMQSEKMSWLNVKEKPDAIIIDSFSELVDKKFIHKNGSSFCGYHSDFIPSSFSSKTLINYGLLDRNKIYKYYDAFFKFIKNKWDAPIIFLHFPTTFESRDIYINQGIAITEALEKLSVKYNIQNIHADESEIEQKDELTYHFSDRTIANMANKIIW